MKKLLVTLLAVVIAAATFAGCGSAQKTQETGSTILHKGTGAPAETTTSKSSTVKNGKIDYLVLVNKSHKLPDDWEKNVKLKKAKNRYGDSFKVEKKALSHFQDLQKELMDKEGIDIELDSVTRTVKEQSKLWEDWTKEKGIDYVKKYVAVPGFSEHHTGLAIDVCLEKDGKRIDDNDDMIAEKETFKKIHKCLAKHGFILRYLEGRDDITGYSYEPWHFRYIDSPKIAKEIMDKDITLEEYLGQVTQKVAEEPQDKSE